MGSITSIYPLSSSISVGSSVSMFEAVHVAGFLGLIASSYEGPGKFTISSLSSAVGSSVSMFEAVHVTGFLGLMASSYEGPGTLTSAISIYLFSSSSSPATS